MVQFPRYESYRDSGIEWVGEIPSKWGIKKLKFLARIKNGQEYKAVQVDEPGYPVIGSGGQFAYASTYLYNGESVLLGRKGTIDKPLYINGKFWTVDTMFYSQINKNVVPKFLYYSALTIPFKYYSTSTALPSMTQEDLGNNSFAYPPLKEQQKIVDFLDQKTAEIDEAIAKKQKLIELLQEQKAILINRAVTKGLNPNVTMRDSGIEWIGKIPEHWKITRLGYYSKVSNGSTPSRENIAYWNNGTIPWVSSGKVNDFVINEPSESITKEGFQKNSLRLYKKGTILVGIVGQGKTRGTSALLNIEACINQNVAAIEPYNNIRSEYLHRYLVQGYQYIRDYGKGANQEALNCYLIKDLRVLIPPTAEQEKIVVYSKRIEEVSSKLTSSISKEIELLTELKQILISNAVTGKIKI